MNHRLVLYTPLISLHNYRTVYENNRSFRKPPLLGPPLSSPEYSYQMFQTISSLIWKDDFDIFPDHATISATIPATICLRIVLNRKSPHEKLSPVFGRGLSPKFLCRDYMFVFYSTYHISFPKWSFTRDPLSARVCA